jgi:hypothetical protein
LTGDSIDVTLLTPIIMAADSPTVSATSVCPVHAGRDDRKSAKIAAQMLAPPPGTRLIKTFGLAREVLRSPLSKQAGSTTLTTFRFSFWTAISTAEGAQP